MSAEEAIQRGMIELQLRRCEALYLDSGNPVFVWKAWRLARRPPGTPLPEWVAQYLDACADRLEREEPQALAEVAAAFGFGAAHGGSNQGTRSKVEAAGTAARRLAIYRRVKALQKKVDNGKMARRPLKGSEGIFPMVARQFGVSADYVRDTYYALKKL